MLANSAAATANLEGLLGGAAGQQQQQPQQQGGGGGGSGGGGGDGGAAAAGLSLMALLSGALPASGEMREREGRVFAYCSVSALFNCIVWAFRVPR